MKSINILKDFIPVTQVVDVPGVLIVHPSVAANSVKELVAYVKANPGKLNYASPGSGSQNRLEMEILRTAERGWTWCTCPTRAEQVRGHRPRRGETQMMFSTVSSAWAISRADDSRRSPSRAPSASRSCRTCPR